jgi:hypothetical protein
MNSVLTNAKPAKAGWKFSGTFGITSFARQVGLDAQVNKNRYSPAPKSHFASVHARWSNVATWVSSFVLAWVPRHISEAFTPPIP